VPVGVNETAARRKLTREQLGEGTRVRGRRRPEPSSLTARLCPLSLLCDWILCVAVKEDMCQKRTLPSEMPLLLMTARC